MNSSIDEKWVAVSGFEGMYEVSNLGRVRAVERTILQANGRYRTFPEKIKVPNDNGTGYKCVNLFKNQKCKRFYIHRLVATHFMDNPLNLPQVNHLSGDKTDNSISNLEWCTASENCVHAVENKLYQNARGEMAGSAKLKDHQVLRIRELLGTGMMQKDIAKLYGVSRDAIGKIARGERWAHI